MSLAAAAALINLWHFVRIVRVRVGDKIIHGDGGNDVMARRMRAHLNFAEHAPIFLILGGLIEAAGKGGQWLALAGGVFMLARVAHAIGMDSANPNPARAAGMVLTILIEAGLAIVAVLILLGRI
jgi:uncharacterized membrane protein YecN with MAPEG domain